MREVEEIRSPGIARKLVAVEGLRVHQQGDKEVRVMLAIDRLDAVAVLNTSST
jgi:hypothetical protein